MIQRSLLACCLLLASAAASCVGARDVSDAGAEASAPDAPREATGEADAVYRRFSENLSSGDLEALVALFADDARYGDRTFEFEVEGRPAIRQLLQATLAGFGGPRMEIRRLVSGGNEVAVEWVIHGVFSGPILGIPPDGEPIELEGVSIGQVSKGQIVQHTDYLDRAALETRLGLRE